MSLLAFFDAFPWLDDAADLTRESSIDLNVGCGVVLMASRKHLLLWWTCVVNDSRVVQRVFIIKLLHVSVDCLILGSLV